MGLYLHIPFCRSKCPYCDFCSVPRPTAGAMEDYTAELTRRIRAAGACYGELTGGDLPPVDTVLMPYSANATNAFTPLVITVKFRLDTR